MPSIRFVLPIALLALLFFSTACGNDATPPDETPTDTSAEGDAQATLNSLIEDDEQLSTLADLLDRTDLDDTLDGAGPFTVFAPTNAAFDALPDGVLDQLNDERLTALLAYHVLPDRLTASEVAGMAALPTTHGMELAVTVAEDGSVLINDATVLRVDIEASNGVLHVVDAVLMPPEETEM